MNKQEIQNKIDNLQKQIDELKKQINKSDNVKPRIKGINYYYIDTCCNINKTKEEYKDFDERCYNIGNYFKTYKEAKDYKDNLITKQKLKDLARKLNNGVEIDWIDDNQKKYFIYYTYYNNRLLINYAGMFKYPGIIYCLDKNFLEIAIQEIGEEELIKLIKSGA